MTGQFVQTEVAFVRLESGKVVRQGQGDALPEGVSVAEITRLAEAGVIGDSKPVAPQPAPDPVADPLPEAAEESSPAQPKGRRTP